MTNKIFCMVWCVKYFFNNPTQTVPFSTNSFQLASLFALLVGLNLFVLIGALAWFFKITKVAPFESVEVFCKDPFLALYFSLFSSINSLLLCFFRQLLSLCWRSGHLVLLPLGLHCVGGYTKSSVSTEALVWVLVFSSQSKQMIKPPSQWIPTKLIFSPTSYILQLPPPFQSHSNISWGHLRPHSFFF